MRVTAFFIILFLAISCQQPTTTELVAQNRFADSTLIELYTWQDQRNTEKLIEFFNHQDATYRSAAALAFASTQDTIAVEALGRLLKDSIAEVRKAAAYALGQIDHISGQPYLLEGCQTEPVVEVKAVMLEALGKCGDTTGLNWLAQASFDNPELETGQAWGLYRASLKSRYRGVGIQKIIELIHPDKAPQTRFAAANHLARLRIDPFSALFPDLSEYAEQIHNSFKAEQDPLILMNLALALRLVPQPKSYELITTAFNSNDYRVVVNAIRAARTLTFDSRDSLILELLKQHPSKQVKVAAAEFFIEAGTIENISAYWEIAEQVTSSRVRALLLKAAHKHATGPMKDSIGVAIKKRISSAEVPYETGLLLSALAEDYQHLDYLSTTLLKNPHPVVRSYCLQAISDMSTHNSFDTWAVRHLEERPTEEPLPHIFAKIFQYAIQTGDAALAGTAASALMRRADYKEILTDYSFLKVAVKETPLPEKFETYQLLVDCLNFFEGRDEPGPAKPKFNNPINWELVQRIPSDQQAEIHTSKGVIAIQLMVDEAPGTTSNFVDLVEQGFFDQKTFHRIVPNFVAQGGCPRGDGWGSKDYSIRAEFPPLPYSEGTIGMASVGPDSESCQWFITHGATPHLEGRYTIFARVVKGMDIVKALEIGDQINSISLR